jgi:hypothetical protein
MSNGKPPGVTARTGTDATKPNKDDATGLVERAARAAETRGESDAADRIRTLAEGGNAATVAGPLASATVWKDCPECRSEWTVWVPSTDDVSVDRLACRACEWSDPVEGQPVRTDGGLAVRDAATDDGAGPIPLSGTTGFQRDLLWVVRALDSPSGQEVKQALERHQGIEVNHGRLYPNLDELVDQGLVEKSQRNRRTNEYDVSRAGRETLRRRRSWEQVRLEGGEEA